MIKKVLLPILGTIAFIVLVGLFTQKNLFVKLVPSPVPTQTKPTITINSKSITVEVVKTETDRQKGLSGRESLDGNSGMLFVFQDTTKAPVFWMKGMLIPLDIVWIKDGKIVRIDQEVPFPSKNTPDNKLKTYSAGVAVNYVLEVNSSFCKTNSVHVGDSVTISGI